MANRPPRDKDGLTAKEKRVLNAYFSNGFNKRAALRAAGYTHASAIGLSVSLFKRPAVIAEIERRSDKEYAASVASENEILALLSQKMRAGQTLAKFKRVLPDGSLTWDFTGASPEDLAIISELSTETYVEGKGPEAQTVKRFKVKHADETTAAQLLMRHKGMLKDKLEVEGSAGLIEILQQRGRQASPEKSDA